jgi:hypothetical protein
MTEFMQVARFGSRLGRAGSKMGGSAEAGRGLEALRILGGLCVGFNGCEVN